MATRPGTGPIANNGAPPHVKISFYPEPLTRDTGCLRVVPGSHLAGSPRSARSSEGPERWSRLQAVWTGPRGCAELRHRVAGGATWSFSRNTCFTRRSGASADVTSMPSVSWLPPGARRRPPPFGGCMKERGSGFTRPSHTSIATDRASGGWSPSWSSGGSRPLRSRQQRPFEPTWPRAPGRLASGGTSSPPCVRPRW